jgi:hypothetical protein
MYGTLTPASGNGWMKKIKGETPSEKLIRIPFVLIFFFTNFAILSALSHKEMRFITVLVQIGQIAQAFMITWCFDTRDVLINWLDLKGFTRSSKCNRTISWVSGWAIKSFALFVLIKQERGRMIRWMLNNKYKQDSGQEAYNLFSGRSDLIGPEQPESVYFMDKFMQPTHLYLHSNPLDYPETAKRRNQSHADWDQTVVVYEAFRAPVFIPDYLKEKHQNGLFDIAIPRDQFNGTDEEYETLLPG